MCYLKAKRCKCSVVSPRTSNSTTEQMRGMCQEVCSHKCPIGMTPNSNFAWMSHLQYHKLWLKFYLRTFLIKFVQIKVKELTPRRITSSTAASALATSCSTYLINTYGSNRETSFEKPLTSQQRKPIKCMFTASKPKQSTNPFTKDGKKVEEKQKLRVYWYNFCILQKHQSLCEEI